jgi:S-formylglutathione hydrolase FrmB
MMSTRYLGPVLLGAVVALVSALTTAHGTAAPTVAHQASPLPASFRLAEHGPDGGSVWEGRIPNPWVPADRRSSAIYLPPGYNDSTGGSYPVLYLLHGFWGSPSSFVDSFRMADTADGLVGTGKARPFVIVMPPGGALKHGRTSGEWAGVWERYVVHAVIPWTDAHLATIASPGGRAIGGLSAGGFGAVDMALRHLGLFGIAESWEGYFTPFRDGPFTHATAADLAAHNPRLLVREHAAYVRDHIRFFLSTGKSHGIVNRESTFVFAHELRSLGIRYRLWVLPPGEVRFGRLQLRDALRYAEPA